jgi:hypothetical protein
MRIRCVIGSVFKTILKNLTVDLMKVLHYDMSGNGGGRLAKNTDRMREAINGLPVEFVNVNRCNRFGNEPYALDLLDRTPFPYDAVIVHGDAPNAKDVADTALTALFVNELPPKRLIYLHNSDAPCDLRDSGVQCVPARGGNGYLNPCDAQMVAGLLRELANS